MIEYHHQQLHVHGQIQFDNAEQYYQQGLNVLQKQQTFPLEVNLSQLQHANTVALAVLIRWLRQTPEANGLTFVAVPEKMLKIIQASHLEHTLNLVS